MISCLPILTRLGGEFLPRLDEGDLLYMPTTAAGRVRRARPACSSPGRTARSTSSTRSRRCSAKWGARRAPPIRRRSRWPRRPSGCGRDPSGPSSSRHAGIRAGRRRRLKRLLGLVWPEAKTPTTAELVEKLDRAVALPGWTNAWTAPARARMDMLSTGRSHARRHPHRGRGSGAPGCARRRGAQARGPAPRDPERGLRIAGRRALAELRARPRRLGAAPACRRGSLR